MVLIKVSHSLNFSGGFLGFAEQISPMTLLMSAVRPEYHELAWAKLSNLSGGGVARCSIWALKVCRSLLFHKEHLGPTGGGIAQVPTEMHTGSWSVPTRGLEKSCLRKFLHANSLWARSVRYMRSI